jgi:diaminopimelate epimerase
VRYFKMNGCGNDFVILDAREVGTLALTEAQVRAIADRTDGVGCDQVIAVERSIRGDAFMRIWNADGGEVAACGNATRCVGWILGQENAPRRFKIETRAGLLAAEPSGPNMIRVDMGSPLLKWEELPLSSAHDTVRLDYQVEVGDTGVTGPGGCNMGNPHVVFFVDDLALVPVTTIGPRVEKDPLFPEGVNVGFAEVRARDHIRLEVWERGAGRTLACGTGACAAVVAGHRQGRVGRLVDVYLPGGVLTVEWRSSDDRVLMTGPVQLEATGVLEPISAL